MFNALKIEKNDGNYECALSAISETDFPEGNVTVAVQFSSLNYKDGLAISGRSPVVRSFPMVPGIDFAGVVEESDDPKWSKGQAVFLNGWGVGEKHWGGLAQKAKTNGHWLLAIPEGMTAYDVMAVGTAGYTAMLCVMALQKHGIKPDSGKVLVTGANGGVGSFAIAFLAKLGFHVVASTGRVEESDHLLALGAAEVIDRTTLSQPGKPLGKEMWAAAIDSVGSHTLANVCASTNYGGVVAACGLAQGMDFPSTVAPFILRGVTLAGVDSVMCPMPIREDAWKQIAVLVDSAMLEKTTRIVGLSDAIPTAFDLLDGKIRGRVVVNVNQ